MTRIKKNGVFKFLRILHTADWHLGSKTDDLNRLKEEKAALDQIIKISLEKKVDMVLIAGDIYDSVIPSAEAESLFFDAIKQLNNNGKTIVVAISGNCDDASRFSNANKFTSKSGIYLLGNLDESANILISKKSNLRFKLVECGKCYLKFKSSDGEIIVLAYLPHTKEIRSRYKNNSSWNFENHVKEFLQTGVKQFNENSINIAMLHLLCKGVELTRDELQIYTTLTNNYCFCDLELLKKSQAHYTALGHIHRNLTVERENHIYYSGSIINNYFESGDALTKVNIVDLSKNGIERLEKVPLAVNLLETHVVSSLLQAEILCRDNPNKLLKITVKTKVDLDVSEINKIKTSYKNLITLAVLKENEKASIDEFEKKDLSNAEIFENFVVEKTGKLPDSELKELFLSLMAEDLYETN